MRDTVIIKGGEGEEAKVPSEKVSEVESRQVFETEDFGDEYTPELPTRENRLRKTISEQTSAG